MMDREGRPLTDPKRANEGFLLPIGDYKGYGLALIIGLIAGTLNRAAMGRDVVDFNADDTTATNTGHAIVAISVANSSFGMRERAAPLRPGGRPRLAGLPLAAVRGRPRNGDWDFRRRARGTAPTVEGTKAVIAQCCDIKTAQHGREP